MPSPVVWIVIAAVMLAAIIVAALVRSTARRTESQLSDARQEMQNSLTAQGQAVTSQLNHLVQSVTQQLGQVRQELQTGIASSGQITADAQRSVSQQLHSATEAVRQISQQLGAVQKAGDDLTRASQTMQQVLGGAKSRGTLGEIALERLLEDSLPQINYSLQHRFSTGDIVDAVIRSAERLLPIDSKFPLDSYRRLVETGEESRKEFAQAVRKHADSIASKYILPGDHTLDIALMFVPSEDDLLRTANDRRSQSRAPRRILPAQSRDSGFAEHSFFLPQHDPDGIARNADRGKRAPAAGKPGGRGETDGHLQRSLRKTGHASAPLAAELRRGDQPPGENSEFAAADVTGRSPRVRRSECARGRPRQANNFAGRGAIVREPLSRLPTACENLPPSRRSKSCPLPARPWARRQDAWRASRKGLPRSF